MAKKMTLDISPLVSKWVLENQDRIKQRQPTLAELAEFAKGGFLNEEGEQVGPPVTDTNGQRVESNMTGEAIMRVCKALNITWEKRNPLFMTDTSSDTALREIADLRDEVKKLRWAVGCDRDAITALLAYLTKEQILSESQRGTIQSLVEYGGKIPESDGEIDAFRERHAAVGFNPQFGGKPIDER